MNDPESAIYVSNNNHNNNHNQNFYINNNDINENLNYNELIEKEKKFSRFVIDYCRASPNINLRQKKSISLGWRNIKFHFEVDIELTNSLNFAIENVIRIFLIFFIIFFKFFLNFLMSFIGIFYTYSYTLK
jgi:hypothetical protein